VEVAAGVMTEWTGVAQYAVAAAGRVIAYVQGEETMTERNLVLVDRDGRQQPVLVEGSIFGPRFSPDGTRVAYAITKTSNTDIEILDVKRGTTTRVTSHPGEDFGPVWRADGQMLAFASEIGQDEGEPGQGLAMKSPDGTEMPARLLKTPTPGEWECPTCWANSGAIVFNGRRAATGFDVCLLQKPGSPDVRDLVATPFDEYDGDVSPDGRWLAYVSDEDGQEQVYVQPLQGGERKAVSRGVGTEPCWSRDGRELFYRDDDRMMAVAVLPGDAFQPGATREVFRGQFDPAPWPGAGPRNYDVDANGNFIMVARKSDVRPQAVHVLLDFLDSTRSRAR
jgi:Tol biopolymer transport system component